MRYCTRYTRVLNMITEPEIPRTPDGGIKLCHWCQREIYFQGGFLEMLQNDLELEAKAKRGKFGRYLRA